MQKARTSVLFRTESGALARRSQPGGALWSIENSNAGLVTFGGGVPLFDREELCIGAVGVSGARSNKTRKSLVPALSAEGGSSMAMTKRRILITGAGTGFGRDAALQLAEKGHEVIAAVHHEDQIAEMKQATAAQGVILRVEKLDLLSVADRSAALQWDVDVLVNNAAVGEGGPIAEIPVDLVRNLFEVNVFTTLALTQGIVKQMVKRGRGRVIFVSSVAGLLSGPYLGAYGASKHAIEAIAESMHAELAPHGIQVATINPGPYGTGFNDRMIENAQRWYDPKRNFTRPQDLATLQQRFARQFDPGELVERMVELVESDAGLYRNVHPKEFEEMVRNHEREAWTRPQSAPSRRAA